VTSVTRARSTEMAGQDQAVGAPAGPANDTRKKTQFKSKDALAPVVASLRTHRSNSQISRRNAVELVGARCGGDGARVSTDDAL
jgi:hypothetical protein